MQEAMAKQNLNQHPTQLLPLSMLHTAMATQSVLLLRANKYNERKI